MWPLIGGVWLGWALGANDAANVMGASVASRMLRFRTAALVAGCFVLIGALSQGYAGMHTYAGLTPMTLTGAVVVSMAAALTVTLLGAAGLPISASQATVGAILGVGLLNREWHAAGFGKIVACWVGTPLGAAVVAMLLYNLAGWFYNRSRLNMFEADALLRVGMIAATAYGAYALGANNVANVSAVFFAAGHLDGPQAALVGGLSIAAGIFLCQRRVIDTVGKSLVRLNAYSGLVVLLAQGLTVHAYTLVGVPVSTSQAVIGAVLGVGLARGTRTVRLRTLGGIVMGWVMTPVLGALLAILIHFVIHLRYVPPAV